jgi:hypothetical protein
MNEANERPQTPQPQSDVPMLFNSPSLSVGSGMIIDDGDGQPANIEHATTLPELVSDDYLSQLGLVMNTKLSVLICRSCKHAVLSVHVQAHLDGKHADAKLRADIHKIDAILTRYQIRDTFEPVKSGAYPPFAALNVTNGFICGSCGLAYGSSKHIKHHAKVEHVGTKVVNIARGPIQHYHSGAGKASTYWTCIPDLHIDERNMDVAALRFMQEMKAKAASLLKVDHVPVDARKIDPWLLTTKWYLLTDGLDNASLRRSVAPATPHTWEECVPNLVHHYLNSTLGMPMPELELQRLNSPDPTTE